MSTTTQLGDPATTSVRHRIIGIAAAVVAFSAFGGAIGLVTGALSVGVQLNARLPLDSPVLGGCALALIVGAPFTLLAARALGGDPRTGITALFVGPVLVGWLLVELAFIRQFSFFHPLYIAIGIAFALTGRTLHNRQTPRDRVSAAGPAPSKEV